MNSTKTLFDRIIREEYAKSKQNYLTEATKCTNRASVDDERRYAWKAGKDFSLWLRTHGACPINLGSTLYYNLDVSTPQKSGKTTTWKILTLQFSEPDTKTNKGTATVTGAATRGNIPYIFTNDVIKLSSIGSEIQSKGSNVYMKNYQNYENPFSTSTEKTAKINSLSDYFHALLDQGGWYPDPIGIAADGANALMYVTEKKWAMAVIQSLALFIPASTGIVKTWRKLISSIPGFSKLPRINPNLNPNSMSDLKEFLDWWDIAIKKDRASVTEFWRACKPAWPKVSSFFRASANKVRKIDDKTATQLENFANYIQAMGRSLDEVIQVGLKKERKIADDVLDGVAAASGEVLGRLPGVAARKFLQQLARYLSGGRMLANAISENLDRMFDKKFLDPENFKKLLPLIQNTALYKQYTKNLRVLQDKLQRDLTNGVINRSAYDAGLKTIWYDETSKLLRNTNIYKRFIDDWVNNFMAYVYSASYHRARLKGKTKLGTAINNALPYFKTMGNAFLGQHTNILRLADDLYEEVAGIAAAYGSQDELTKQAAAEASWTGFFVGIFDEIPVLKQAITNYYTKKNQQFVDLTGSGELSSDELDQIIKSR